MLAMKGIPGVYFHSLVGTPNDGAGVAATGRARSINRRKFDWPELIEQSPLVLEGYRRWLKLRIEQPALHPDATQEVVEMPSTSLVGFFRESLDPARKILVLGNVGSQSCEINLRSVAGRGTKIDLQTGRAVADRLTLDAWDVAWLDVS